MTIDQQDLARQRDLAWSEALLGLSRVAGTLGTRLRDIHPARPSTGAQRRTPAAARPASPSGGAGRARLPRGGFGPRQQAVLALGGLDQDVGLAASEVAGAIGLAAPNAHKLLTGLEKMGALERVPDERPIRWRRALA